MKPYSEYKKSDSKLTNKIPKNWAEASLKRTVDGCVNGIWGNEPDGKNDIACIRVADFDRASNSISTEKLTFRSVSYSERANRLVKSGDLLIEKSGGGDKTLVGAVAIFQHDFDAVTSNFVAKMSPYTGYSARFLNYCFSALYSSNINYCSIKQTTGIQNLDSEAYLQEKVGVPSYSEQQKIAQFLDYETAKIDVLIDEQKRLIELLKEKRKAVISHAVTKGLNPDAPMKGSGVEWLGDVPEHWVISRIKNFANIESGHTPSKKFDEYWENADIPWVSLNDSKQLKRVDYIDATAFKISELGIANSSARLLPEKAVVFTRDASIGLAAITTRKMAVSQHLIAWLCLDSKLIPEYLLLIFYAMEKEFERYTFGATIKTIGLNDVRSLTAAFPNIEEQKEIVSWAFTKKQIIEQGLINIEKSISLLKERRSALISAAVTGKIDVCDWQPPAGSDTVDSNALVQTERHYG